MQLESLDKESSDPALVDLKARLALLTGTLEKRGAKLDSMIGKVSNLTENVKSLESWIVTVVQNLQGKFTR